MDNLFRKFFISLQGNMILRRTVKKIYFKQRLLPLKAQRIVIEYFLKRKKEKKKEWKKYGCIEK